MLESANERWWPYLSGVCGLTIHLDILRSEISGLLIRPQGLPQSASSSVVPVVWIAQSCSMPYSAGHRQKDDFPLARLQTITLRSEAALLHSDIADADATHEMQTPRKRLSHAFM